MHRAPVTVQLVLLAKLCISTGVQARICIACMLAKARRTSGTLSGEFHHQVDCNEPVGTLNEVREVRCEASAAGVPVLLHLPSFSWMNWTLL